MRHRELGAAAFGTDAEKANWTVCRALKSGITFLRPVAQPCVGVSIRPSNWAIGASQSEARQARLVQRFGYQRRHVYTQGRCRGRPQPLEADMHGRRPGVVTLLLSLMVLVALLSAVWRWPDTGNEAANGPRRLGFGGKAIGLAAG